MSERALREIYLRGFEIAVKKVSPHALMTSYNLVNGIHTSERKDLTEDGRLPRAVLERNASRVLALIRKLDPAPAGKDRD